MALTRHAFGGDNEDDDDDDNVNDDDDADNDDDDDDNDDDDRVMKGRGCDDNIDKEDARPSRPPSGEHNDGDGDDNNNGNEERVDDDDRRGYTTGKGRGEGGMMGNVPRPRLRNISTTEIVLYWSTTLVRCTVVIAMVLYFAPLEN
jgi:hypothetical protein